MVTKTTRPKPTPAPTPARSVPWLWIGLAVLVVGAIVTAVLLSGGNDSNKAAPTNSSGVTLEQTAVAAITGTPLPALPSGESDPAVGMTIPTVDGRSFDGSAVHIAADGKPKLILFAAHWCPHCQRELPLIASYFQQHGLPAGVEVIVVSTAVSADRPNYPPSDWLAGLSWPTPIMADTDTSAVAQAFGLPGYPYFVAVSADNKVVARTSGELPITDFATLLGQVTPAKS